MHSAEWITALDGQSPRTVLRLRLEPYSIGHELLLSKYENPFIVGGIQPDLTDLVYAVFICASPARKAEKYLRAWWFPFWLWLWGRFCRKCNILHEIEAFALYRSEGAWFPDTNSIPGRQRTLESNYLARLIVFAMVTLHLTFEQALDFPMSRLNVLFAAQAELDDQIQLYSEADAVLFRKARELAEEAKC